MKRIISAFFLCIILCITLVACKKITLSGTYSDGVGIMSLTFEGDNVSMLAADVPTNSVKFSLNGTTLYIDGEKVGTVKDDVITLDMNGKEWVLTKVDS